ncbi:MAG: hypothetical protein ICV63_12960 [Coleofasciculus sp. Co-bin14]|nr:hypothetical protein [Coleofasciculus sp. Co-bin14]
MNIKPSRLQSIGRVFLSAKITAKVQTVDLAQFSQLGVAGVIAKPFGPLTLAQQVASTVGRSFQNEFGMR